MTSAELPSSPQLEGPILHVLAEGAAPISIATLDALVARNLGLADALLAVPHSPGKGKRTEFSYRMAWARTRLKAKGLIERAGPGLWVRATVRGTLTPG